MCAIQGVFPLTLSGFESWLVEGEGEHADHLTPIFQLNYFLLND